MTDSITMFAHKGFSTETKTKIRKCCTKSNWRLLAESYLNREFVLESSFHFSLHLFVILFTRSLKLVLSDGIVYEALEG